MLVRMDWEPTESFLGGRGGWTFEVTVSDFFLDCRWERVTSRSFDS